jgi:D-serine deaminase-like pyridoxal phosphate-dependent protein
MGANRRDSNDRVSLETPALLLDVDALENNLTRMRSHLRQLGVALRPHVKTTKSIAIVRRALEGQPGGITVSTLKEAEYFLENGIRDILYAVGSAPGSKLEHVTDLIRRGAELTLILDNAVAVDSVTTAARRAGVRIPILVEIDVDGHRAGVGVASPELIAVGRAVHEADSLELRGVMTHAGGSYECRSPQALRAAAAQERLRSVAAAERLRAAGLPCPVVSVGSTPTALFAESFEGVSEVRAGVYMFQDLVMAGLGVCRIEDIAISVLACVIGHQTQRSWLITDGGWMALSRDRGTASQSLDQGYGVVRTADGRAPPDDLIVVSANQEHGIIGHRSGARFDVEQYPVGTLLRILPNHACATAAQHDRYHLVRTGSYQVLDNWPRIAGW